MIRINLLPAERERAKGAPARLAISEAQRVTIGACLLLLLTGLGIGWWFWTLRETSTLLDQQIVQAETEARDLQSVLAKVGSFEGRRAQLQQRVTLIEQLRKGQSASARVLDQISRSVPERLWLIDLSQVGADFTLTGFATSMTALSDFVGSIEGTAWFHKPVEIIDSQVTSDPATGELVRFAIKATYADPSAPPAAAAAAKSQ